jgi:hypothetical protein
MKVIGERNPGLWGVEVVIAVLTTFMLLPMLLLYLLDLFAGKIAPDAIWAFGAAIAVLGIWLALLRPDSTFQGNALLRGCVIAMLIIGISVLADLTWGSHQLQGMGYGVGLLVKLAPTGVVLHQLVRLLRL